MKLNIFILLLLTVTTFSAHAAPRVRRVEVHGDQIVTVRTCLGIATIIQVPDRPNSVVVGDQDAFRVEYLDQAITIKPISEGTKSNLYIYTDWKRYNVELVSGGEGVADYVVYLETPKDKPVVSGVKGGVRWTDFKNALKNEQLTLNINRIGRAQGGILLIEFTVRSKSKEKFKPEWLWLTQDGMTRPIHNLFLSSLEVSPQKRLSGVLQLKLSDINLEEPMRLEMRRSRISYLTLIKVNSWKP